MIRCTDCNRRCGRSFYIDWHYPGAQVCDDCVTARRASNPTWFWIGMETVHEVPNVGSILIGTIGICLGIITIVLLCSGRLG
jgi:hypothetical protein